MALLPRTSKLGLLALRCLVTVFNRFPIHRIPPCGQIIRAPVLVEQIVRVLPHIDAKDWRLARHIRVVLIRRAFDTELARLVDGEPRPAAAETSDAGFRELLLEFIET